MNVKEQLLQEVIDRDGSMEILSVNILRNWSVEKMVKLRDFLVARTPTSPPEAAGRGWIDVKDRLPDLVNRSPARGAETKPTHRKGSSDEHV